MNANALEVYKNGELVCTIGLTAAGVLGGLVEIRRNKNTSSSEPVSSAFLYLHGLENLPEDMVKFLHWNPHCLEDGDEVMFKLTSTSVMDAPSKTRIEERSQKQ